MPSTLQDVRHQVVGEDGELVEVVEPAPAFVLEGEAQVGGGQLRALHERHLVAVPDLDVVEERHDAQDRDQLFRLVPRAFHQLRRVAAEARQQQRAQVVQRLGEQAHQLGRRRLPRSWPNMRAQSP